MLDSVDSALEDLQSASGALAKVRAAAALAGEIAAEKKAVPQTETQEFKRWFGRSIAVDDDGKPQVMYHGSYRDVTEFDRLASTKWRAQSMDTVGIWFSDNPGKGGAEMYASGEGAAVYPVYLRIERPKVYDSFQLFLRDMHEAEGRQVKDGGAQGLGSAEGLREKLKAQGYDGIAFTKTSNQERYDEADEIRQAIERATDEYRVAAAEFRSKGLEMTRADGMPYQAKIDRLQESLKRAVSEVENNGSTEFDQQNVWVVFEPNQVKSAIGNSGAFDPSSNSILDSISAIDRIKLTSQLAGQVSAMGKAANAIERVRVAKQVADLVRQLSGEGAAAELSTAFPTKEAASSYSGISHSGGGRAQLDQEEYERNIAKEVAAAQPFAETAAQQAALEAEEAALRADYIQQYRRMMSVRAGTYSGYVAGRAKLNAKQANSRNSAYDKSIERFNAWLKENTGRIKRAVLAARSPEQLEAARAEQDAAQAEQAAAAQAKQQKSIELMAKLLAFKKGDDLRIGESVVTKVSKDRDGYPSTLTFTFADGTKPFDDKLDLARVLYRGDKAALRRDADAAKALLGANATSAAPVTPPKLDLPTVEHLGDTWHILSTGTRREDGKVFAHLSSTTRGTVTRNGINPVQANDYIDLPAEEAIADPAPAPEIIEHITGKGKTLRGIVRTDLTYAEAKAIDEFTFKKNGGYFIREKHLAGYVPGEAAPVVKPQLTPEQQAQAEADRLANEQLKQQQKRTEQVAKLREVAQATIEKAEAELGRDRLANTARRARMAASSNADSEVTLATGKTLLNLADAIESGEATHLAGISSRSALETLQYALRQGMIAADSAAKLSYSEQERQKGRAPNENDAKHAKFPMAMWGTAGNSIARTLEAIKGKRGSVELAKKISYSPGPDAEIIKALRDMIGKKEADYQLGWWSIEQVARADRLRRAGINNTEELQAALVEYLQFREGARKEDPIKAAERAIIGQKVGIDFFPTPSGEAQRMVQLAGITPGERVLEPSAGNGNIADAAAAAGAKVDVIEISDQLRKILEAKGYDVVAHDFMQYEPSEKYDAVLMNPPFSDRMDAQHIMHAFDMLKPGGRLVAIAGEGVFIGSDKRAVAFREWLDEHAAEVEQLPQGTFTDNKLLARTSANGRMLVMQKD